MLGASSFYWNCKHGFVTAEVRVGAATTIDFGKQSRITCLPGRGAYWNCKQGWLCPSLAVLFRHLLRQIVLTEPLRISYFLTAGITSGKISLVQITISFFGLGDFLYDTFGSIIVGTCFCR